MKITDLPKEYKPRERLVNTGAASLSEAELLAILIRTGTKEKNAVELGRELFSMSNNNLTALGKLSVEEIKSIKGISTAKAVTIAAALELGRRRKESDNQSKKIGSSQDVFELFSPLLTDLPYEEFWVLYLSRSNRIINKLKISQGGISSTVTDIRLLMKRAIELLASNIILCHNHPSGNLTPSSADIALTKKIKQAAELFDICLLDHIIIAENRFYSMSDNGHIYS